MILVLLTLPSRPLYAQYQVGQRSFASGTAPVTWTLVQHSVHSCSGTSATSSTQTFACSFTVTSTGAGNLLKMLSAMYVQNVASLPTFLSASGDSAWTHFPAQYEHQTTNTGTQAELTDGARILSSTGGATSFTYNWTGQVASGFVWAIGVEFVEVHRSTGTATFDGCTTGTGCISVAAGTATRTSPSGCMVSGTDDYVSTWIADSISVVSISGGAYTNPFDTETGAAGGFAGALNQSSSPAQTWNTGTPGSVDGAAMSCEAEK